MHFGLKSNKQVIEWLYVGFPLQTHCWLLHFPLSQKRRNRYGSPDL